MSRRCWPPGRPRSAPSWKRPWPRCRPPWASVPGAADEPHAAAQHHFRTRDTRTALAARVPDPWECLLRLAAAAAGGVRPRRIQLDLPDPLPRLADGVRDGAV